MPWLNYIDLISERIIEIIIMSFLVGLIYYFIITPYKEYQTLKRELAKVLYKNAPIAHNIGLSQQSYNDAYDELRKMGEEIKGFINRIKLEKMMEFLKIPNKKEINDAIGRINRVMNCLNRPNMITQIFKDYQRIKEIFKIE